MVMMDRAKHLSEPLRWTRAGRVAVIASATLLLAAVIVLAVLGQPVVIRPLFISKVNTLLQILLVAVTMLQAGFGLSVWGVAQPLIWVVAATTLASGSAYVWVAARRR